MFYFSRRSRLYCWDKKIVACNDIIFFIHKMISFSLIFNNITVFSKKKFTSTPDLCKKKITRFLLYNLLFICAKS